MPLRAPPHLTRRHALCCAAALGAGLFSALLPKDSQADTTSAGLLNACADPRRADAAVQELLAEALEGLDGTRLVDVHAHLLGVGDGGSGCSVHPSMGQWWHPLESLRKRVILKAACVDAAAPSIDQRYVERVLALAAGFPAGARWWLFAFAQAHDDAGRPRPDWSSFHVPNAYAAAVARAHSERFDWVASIHPYADDALEQLQHAARDGAVAVKWLPSAMNIDPAARRCGAFYAALRGLGLPLIVHCGEEKAAPGARRDALVNPLRLREPLAAGVRVVVAHAASLGHAEDLDLRSSRLRPAFDLFLRLAAEQRGHGRLVADISAVFQRNRDSAVWRRLLGDDALHPLLVHGSDYPLPGVVPLVSLGRLVEAGLLDGRRVPALQRLRDHNPLLFDLVLKRSLRLGQSRLPASVFEARALAPTSEPT